MSFESREVLMKFFFSGVPQCYSRVYPDMLLFFSGVYAGISLNLYHFSCGRKPRKQSIVFVSVLNY